MATTLRKMLNHAQFNWAQGEILVQFIVDKEWEPTPVPGWSRFDPVQGDYTSFIEYDNPILDAEFDSGFGSPDCPRFVAKDKEKIYFPVQYDGSTWLEWIWLDIDKYTIEDTPYPGG
jgi:hypothetical protein